MGIRYYAYAFDKDQAEKALADPLTVIGSDPLADAWGLLPASIQGVTEGRQPLPEHDFLYLDKAWPYLQRLTAPPTPSAGARPAYLMFEGDVTYTDCGLSWHPWLRTLLPPEVALIARDLEAISDHEIEAGLGEISSPHQSLKSEVAYATDFFHRAKAFVHAVASEGRGFAYMIG
ncbi:hypothetical protein D477_004202 [Arthrobacter crystallopoietes BAB-32]|uniref:DUF1877 domain-containing protein n=1 Tax=Arthrobacter crystallopoietes BAB-32 TaxID=1246476 RepID=N1V5W3_9MICC|nr:hypothetical protein [Arthrobacter crystallopoietes]EMY35487.1 hypothetical protein D477_004202 [Arthrobacter crystallopoietes BAB-32]